MPIITPDRYRYILFVLFALSGASGLIYESVWSHYLKLLLGHAAYAQALVLIIFMGGMAVGAWWASRLTVQKTGTQLLVLYAVAEACIGLSGFLFDPVYQSVTIFMYDRILPGIGHPFLIQFCKLLVASSLVLPQSVLLGATFPLMSAGLIRTFLNTPGHSIALLYFFNCLGGAGALLFSAFVLIASVGLPGTLSVAATLNILIAAGVLLTIRMLAVNAPAAMLKTGLATSARSGLVLSISFLTGMASFIYEITWIRMLSMVLGSSTFSFELMLSAFIGGLAIGGYLIRKRIDRIADPVNFAVIIQVMMGIFALLTIFMYGHTFETMSFFMHALDSTEQGYTLFSFYSHIIALVVMLPATICAGMILPLLTVILLRQGNGEESIGQIYASNTAGAIAGILFAVFLGLPLLGIKGALLSGAFIDIAAGVILLTRSGVYIFRSRNPAHAPLLLSIPLLIAVAVYQFNLKVVASGVFRHGSAQLDDKTDILFHQDGKTASVTVTEWDKKQISIMTNGKPDAAITMAAGAPPSVDEATMTLLAALPLSVHPDARNIANIGMGSGMTAHVALNLPSVERVDTIEIEEAIIEGARHFIPKTEKVFNDPRSHIVIDDARAFFSANQSRYDIIISEPSNPWVSGVSSLFTAEFYRQISTHLNPGGLLAQWIHIYELDTELLVSILKSITTAFPYYSLYFADEGNLILLASTDQQISFPDRSIFEAPAMKQHLSSVHIHSIEDIDYRFLGDQTLWGPFIAQSPIHANSDFYPYLDLHAEKARFLNKKTAGLLDIRLTNEPILDILYEHRNSRDSAPAITSYYPASRISNAVKIHDFARSRIFDKQIIEAIANQNYLTANASGCNQDYIESVWTDSFFMILGGTVAYLPKDQLEFILNAVMPSCGDIQPAQKLWIDLFRSLIVQDYPNAATTVIDLLDSTTSLPTDQRQYLSTVLLTLLTKNGESAKVEYLWENYMKELYGQAGGVPLYMQVLLARSGLTAQARN